MKISRHCLKSLLIGSLMVFAVLLVSLQYDQYEPSRLRIIPRLVTTKEIRGSTYHIHHGAWENKGYDHESTRHKNSKLRYQYKQMLKKRYPTKKVHNTLVVSDM